MGGAGVFASYNDAAAPHSRHSHRSGLLLPHRRRDFTHPGQEKARASAAVGRRFRILIGVALLGGVSACGDPELQAERAEERRREQNEISDESFFDLFRSQSRADRPALVNRYLWQASLETLSFLPLDTADPFSGLILTDWGSVGGGAFRVTILISDPALDASSLKVAAFRQQGGRAVAVSEAENRQLEDAILTRARQIRIAEFESGG
jgi:hypothetical protein